MAHGKSLELRDIPRRTREWVVQHVVKDARIRGVDVPQPANRAERRAAERGKPWYGNPLGQRMVVDNMHAGIVPAGKGGR